MLENFEVARAAADPSSLAAQPGGWPGLHYYRLHGSPRMYYSSYPTETLDSLAQRLTRANQSGAETWCIFDNTAEGAAIINGLELIERLKLGQ
jgi:uncharacterized protein YecE (DUF72 family)